VASLGEFRYRPDVDGLRAVAVALVIMFHLHSGVSGGFIGVDVFFVISGYLITGLILKEQDSGQFRLSHFWARRIRRILPASCAMVLVTLLMASVFLFPSDFVSFARSMKSQLFMASNFYFWRNTGYFDGESHLMPLLHTWSLAVEEQFYFFYPPVLIVVQRWAPQYRRTILCVMTVGSLAISQWGLTYSSSATFFLLPTRAWEILLGGCICVLPSKRRVESILCSELVSAMGALAIAWASLTYDSRTRFPGAAALVPCMGTAAIIYSNSRKLNTVGRLLTCRPIVFVGLLSYSLYLWHWPIIVFANYWLPFELTTTLKIALCITAVIVSYASWRWIEQPLRYSKTMPPKVLHGSILGIIIVAMICAQLVQDNAGFPSRFSDQVVRFHAAKSSRRYTGDVSLDRVRKGEFPRIGARDLTESIAIWGDSHAMALLPGFDESAKASRIAGIFATRSSTPPILDFLVPKKPGAPEFNRAVVDHLVVSPVDVVVLTAAWNRYARFPDFEANLKRTLNKLVDSGKQVVVILDVPFQGIDIPHELSRRASLGLPHSDLGVTPTEHQMLNQEANDAIRRVAQDRVWVVDPTRFLEIRDGRWPAVVGDVVLYRDKGHLTVEGSLHLRHMFDEIISTALQKVVDSNERPHERDRHL
jgi:peptidoglycan/LPS O-acetylase OafA/YrhL